MCPKLETLLEWRDGNLANAERDEIAEHILGCAACREAIRFEARVAGAIPAARNASVRAAVADAHPDEFDLAMLAEGNPGDGRRQELVAHVAACENCRVALADYMRDLRVMAPDAAPHRYAARGFALSEERETEGELQGLPSPSLASRLLGFLWPAPGGSARWLRPAGALALVLLAVTLLPLARSGPGGPPDEGGTRDSTDTAGFAIIRPAADRVTRAALATGTFEFAWTRAAGATSYRAVLAAVDGTILSEIRTVETRWTPRIDETKLAGAGRVLFWIESFAGERKIESLTRTLNFE
ncbi:MAG: zf-HC2 domain-containing protein [bacterium]